MKKTSLLASAAVITMLAALPAKAEFKEFPIGEAVEVNTLEVAAVYLNPIAYGTAWHRLACFSGRHPP